MFDQLEGKVQEKPRVAIVLFNLGGPDCKAAIKPFLRNLFLDPAILRVPFFIRPFLARYIAARRVKPASENYALLGDKSPLLELTELQARALEAALPEWEAKCFTAMRYWHPMSEEVARAVAAWGPDHVVLLPLYPQFSTTTTGSSLTAWRDAASAAGLVAPVTTICCYPVEPAFAASAAELLAESYRAARAALPPEIKLRVLFSAHGLPEIIIKRGDPYQSQVERTVDAVLEAWTDRPADIDWVICYQSRATPQVWIGPSTDAVIEEAGRDNVAVLVQPIAFVSEHSETLVELDVEYRELAERAGVPGYFRVPAQNDQPAFIAALAGIARGALAAGPGLCRATGEICDKEFTVCPWHGAVAHLADA
jgi:ferrochelatase